MKRTSDERMEEARAFFSARAAAVQDEAERQQLTHLADMAESVQEVVRTLDYMKIQLQEIRHALSLH